MALINLTKLNIVVQAGAKAMASTFNAVTKKVDDVIDFIKQEIGFIVVDVKKGAWNGTGVWNADADFRSTDKFPTTSLPTNVGNYYGVDIWNEGQFVAQVLKSGDLSQYTFDEMAIIYTTSQISLGSHTYHIDGSITSRLTECENNITSQSTCIENNENSIDKINDELGIINTEIVVGIYNAQGYYNAAATQYRTTQKMSCSTIPQSSESVSYYCIWKNNAFVAQIGSAQASTLSNYEWDTIALAYPASSVSLGAKKYLVNGSVVALTKKHETEIASIKEEVNKIDLSSYDDNDFEVLNFGGTEYLSTPYASFNRKTSSIIGCTSTVIKDFTFKFFSAYCKNIKLGYFVTKTSNIYVCPGVVYNNGSVLGVLNMSLNSSTPVCNILDANGDRYQTMTFFCDYSSFRNDVTTFLALGKTILGYKFEKVADKSMKISYVTQGDVLEVLGTYATNFEFDLTFATFCYTSGSKSTGDTLNFNSMSYKDFSIISPKKIDLSKVSTSFKVSRPLYILGDSTSYGAGSGTSSVLGSTSWSDRLVEKLSFSTYTKLAVSGTVTQRYENRNYLANEVAQIPDNTNGIIIVMIGTNDVDRATLGTVEDAFSVEYSALNDTTNFARAFRYNMETIIRKCPMASVICMLPISPQGTSESNMESFREVERGICEALSIPVIETRKECGITKYCNYIVGVTDNITTPTGLMADSLHPNNAGYEKIANYMRGYLMRYVDSITIG